MSACHTTAGYHITSTKVTRNQEAVTENKFSVSGYAKSVHLVYAGLSCNLQRKDCVTRQMNDVVVQGTIMMWVSDEAARGLARLSRHDFKLYWMTIIISPKFKAVKL